MKTIKLIAACALFMGATASFGHENMPMLPNRRVVKEQKAGGIAGDAKAVTCTITLRMGDDMRFAPATSKCARAKPCACRPRTRAR